MKIALTCIATCGILILSPKPAQAVIYINFVESGGDVVANSSGSVIIDIAGAGITESGRVDASAPAFFIGAPVDTDADRYPLVVASGPASFGAGSNVAASFGSGDLVGIGADLYNLIVPLGYVSGSAVSGTATWTGQSFGTLGLTPGTYEYIFAGGESVSLNIGATVPEPSTALPLLGLMLGLMCLRRTRR